MRMKKKRETETGFDIDIATRRCAEEEQTLRRRSVHFRSLLQVYGEQRGREEEKGLGLFVNIRLVWQIYNNKKLFDRRFWGSTL